MINSRRMRKAGHVARIGENRTEYAFWYKYLNGRDHLEDLDVDESIILKCISEKNYERVRPGLMWLSIGASGGLL
jgi:hypothetical protein